MNLKNNNHILPSENLNYDSYFYIFKKEMYKEHNKRYSLLNKGIILLDKPKGITSHQITYKLRDNVGAKKAGHSGTLDPNVTGLMLITLGKACKLMPVFQNLGKEYVGTMHLHKDIEEEKIKLAFSKFTGIIEQVPPVRSAVKRVKRKRKVYYLELLEKKGKEVKFLVGCEAGTYIRKLCVDIGNYLEVGAHMTSLKRTKIGYIKLSDAFNYEEIVKDPENKIRKLDFVLKHIPKAYVKNIYTKNILNGEFVKKRYIYKISKNVKKDDYIVIYTSYNEPIALAKSKYNLSEIKLLEDYIKVLKILSVLGCENL